MANSEIAVSLLIDAGYEAVSYASNTVIVQDPVRCSCGSREWTEMREVSMNIGRDTAGVHRFLNDRE